MAKVDDIYQGSYMNVERFSTSPETHTIHDAGADPDQFAKAEGAQVIWITIDDTDTKIRVNRTNAAVLKDAFGGDTDDWIGKEITLHRKQAKIKGKSGWEGVILPASKTKRKGSK